MVLVFTCRSDDDFALLVDCLCRIGQQVLHHRGTSTLDHAQKEKEQNRSSYGKLYRSSATAIARTSTLQTIHRCTFKGRSFGNLAVSSETHGFASQPHGWFAFVANPKGASIEIQDEKK